MMTKVGINVKRPESDLGMDVVVAVINEKRNR